MSDAGADAYGWTIQEWPHSRMLGELWIAFPPRTPPEQEWPGLKFFVSREAALEWIAGGGGKQ